MKALFQKKIIWFFLIGIAIGIGAWWVIPQWNQSQITNGKSKKEVSHTVRKENLKQTLTISGKLDAEEKIIIRFQSSGYLSWMGVKIGDSVKKYQALASLDQQELKKNLEKYLNTYLKTRWDFEQVKDEYRAPAQNFWNLSWDQRNDVDRAFQKAQFDLNNSVLDVELKDIALKYSTLISPINGIVTNIGMPVAGVNVTPTQAEIEITNPDTIYFSLLPDQNEVTTITASMAAQIVFDSYPEETVSGVVKSIAFTPKDGESSTVYEVKIQYSIVDPSHTKYRIGMTGDATFTTKERADILTIPNTFIKIEKDKKYVMKQFEKKKEKVYIETGLEGDTSTEILGGLAEGDVIYD